MPGTLWESGLIVEVPLPDGKFAYGKVLDEFKIVFFNGRFSQPPSLEDLEKHSRIFTAMVAFKLDTPSGLRVIGKIAVASADQSELWALIRMPGGGFGVMNESMVIRPATPREAETLYPMVAFSRESLIERLSNELDGKFVRDGRRYPIV